MTSKPLTLLNLPISIANQVLEKLGPVEILTCRKVCRSLRSAIDESVHFNKISIELWIHSVSFYFDKVEITYRNAFNRGSYMEYNGQRKTIEGVNYMNAAFNDLKILLRNTSDLYISRKQEYVDVRSLVNFLKADVNIHVETLTLNIFSLSDVLLILQSFESQRLKEISLRNIHAIGQFKRITCLDQWKNAKKFSCWNSLIECPPIEYFFHFEEFSITAFDFPIQSAIKVRDDLLQRRTFQKCTFLVLKRNLSPVEFARIFQPDYAGGDEFTLEYSNGKYQFEINFGDGPFQTSTWKFEIKRS